MRSMNVLPLLWAPPAFPCMVTASPQAFLPSPITTNSPAFGLLLSTHSLPWIPTIGCNILINSFHPIIYREENKEWSARGENVSQELRIPSRRMRAHTYTTTICPSISCCPKGPKRLNTSALDPIPANLSFSHISSLPSHSSCSLQLNKSSQLNSITQSKRAAFEVNHAFGFRTFSEIFNCVFGALSVPISL